MICSLEKFEHLEIANYKLKPFEKVLWSRHSSFLALLNDLPLAEIFGKKVWPSHGEGSTDISTRDWHAEEVAVGRKYVQTWCFMTHRCHSSHLQPALSGKTILPDVLNVTYKRAFLFLKDHFLSQGFWPPMHKIYKDKQQTVPGKTSLATPSLGPGDQSSKGRQDRDSQPPSITAIKQMWFADALDRDGRLSKLLPFVSQSTSCIL